MNGVHEKKWKIFASRLRRYVHEFGGWEEIFGSPLFNLSLVIALLNWQYWENDWVDISRSLVPSMLGFSLGTYAIIFSILSPKLKRSLREVPNEKGIPYLREMNATFFHYIIVQVTALMLGFLHSGTSLFIFTEMIFGRSQNLNSAFYAARILSGFAGTTLLIYSLLLAISAALIVYRLATIVEPESQE